MLNILWKEAAYNVFHKYVTDVSFFTDYGDHVFVCICRWSLSEQVILWRISDFYENCISQGFFAKVDFIFKIYFVEFAFWHWGMVEIDVYVYRFSTWSINILRQIFFEVTCRQTPRLLGRFLWFINPNMEKISWFLFSFFQFLELKGFLKHQDYHVYTNQHFLSSRF